MRENRKESGDVGMSGDEGEHGTPLLPSISTHPIIPILLIAGPGLVRQNGVPRRVPA
jgi:hypothetical protein